MGSFKIERSHEIHCGHRVYGHEGKCRHLHGHSYIFHLKCQSTELDSLGRVVDFSVIKSILCQWLEDNWDHKLLLWEQDPALPALQAIDSSVVALPVNPTAENLARYVVEVVGPQLLAELPVSLSEVIVEETTKCRASYAISD